MKNKPLYALYLLFFVMLFLLQLLVVRPELIYHSQQLGFSSAKSFLSDYLIYPGGVAEYFSLLLFQFFVGSLGGALTITMLLVVIFLLSKAILGKRKSPFDLTLSLIPVSLVAVLYANYLLHPVYPVLLLSILAFFALFKFVFSSKFSTPIVLFLIALVYPFIYYCIGGFGFMLFVLSTVIYILFQKRKDGLLYVGLMVVLWIALPFIAQKIFQINSPDAYFRLTPYFSKIKPGILLYCTFFSVPMMIILQKVLQISIPAGTKNRNHFLLSDKFCWDQIAIVSVLMVAGLFFNIDAALKHKLKVDYLAQNRQWDELLQEVEKKPSTDRLVQFQTIRALYHKGLLTEKLFNYPMTWGVDGLILTRHFDDDVFLPSMDLLFDLAYLNEAIHIGSEALSMNEYSPYYIERMILSNIAANKYRSALLYVNVLKGNPAFKKKAIEYELFLQGRDNSSELAKTISEKRRLMPENDFIVDLKSPDNDLLNILTDKPQNKMVYEYLMAYYLLNNNVESFVTNFGAGQQLGYSGIPAIFQEALILYVFDQQQKGIKIKNVPIDKGIASSFNDYLTIVANNNGDLGKAQPELEQKFGHTYWYYVNYISPVTKNKKQ